MSKQYNHKLCLFVGTESEYKPDEVLTDRGEDTDSQKSDAGAEASGKHKCIDPPLVSSWFLFAFTHVRQSE